MRKNSLRHNARGLPCLLVLLCPALFAQAPAPPSAVNPKIGWIPKEFMERPIPVREGIGSLHETVTTSSKEAQTFYDQGLAYLESYVWTEAARSFHQALRSDPKLAMAYLGLSYAYSPMDFAAAQEAWKRAQSLAGSLSDREKRRIQIRELQLQAMIDPSKIERTLAMRDALDDALAAYPGDVIFLLLRGVAQESSPFADGQGCDMGCAPFFEQVLATAPQNFAAHHFLTHCYENSGRVEEALPHAKLYAELAPEIPHAQHMYGHVLRRAGQMDAAIIQFLKTDQLERDYFRRENIPAWYDWHYAHNLGLLASSYQYLGEMKKAEKNFEAAAGLPAFTDYDSFNRKDWPEFLLDRGRYTEMLTATQALAARPSPLAKAAAYALNGDAQFAMGRTQEAADQLKLAEKTAAQMRPVDTYSVRIYIDGLRATLLLKAGETAQAEGLFQGILGRIRATNGPDTWTQGLFHLEFLCRVARNAGDWGLAAEMAEAMSERAPDYAGSHYALGLIARHNGNSQAAAQEFATAEMLWREADAVLPELVASHRALAELSKAGAH